MSFPGFLQRVGLLPPAYREGVIVIRPWKVAFFRVPKVANTSVKTELARALGLSSETLKPTRDLFWKSVDPQMVDLISPRAFARQEEYREYFSFAIVRDPRSRLLSCYRNKFVRNGQLTESFRRRGFQASMTFGQFAARACALSDARSDVHTQSQSSMLMHQGILLPQVVVKMEKLKPEWNIIRKQIGQHCGVELGRLKKRNHTSKVESDIEISAETDVQVMERYRCDFQSFGYRTKGTHK